jgi:hypothetical protein
MVRDNVPEFLEEASLSEADKNAIAHGNVEKLLRI